MDCAQSSLFAVVATVFVGMILPRGVGGGGGA